MRVMMTFGWMAGCVLASALNADTSSLAGYASATIWLVAGGVHVFSAGVGGPPIRREPHLARTAWSGRPYAAEKPRPSRHFLHHDAVVASRWRRFIRMRRRNLRDLGLAHTSAWMSIAQISEVIAIFSMGWLLLNWRLKWIFACGLGFGVLRFVLSAVNDKTWLLAGVAMHGASFALVFVTAQIYLDQRVDAAWRARAQALMTLMNGGVGNLIGYLGTGWWFAACARSTGTQWPLFWGGMAAIVSVVMVYFLTAYRGGETKIQRMAEAI